MKIIWMLLVILFLLPGNSINAQTKFKWMKDKPGKWIYKYNINNKSTDEIQFKKNITDVAEWFHQNISLFNKPTGYNLDVYISGSWDEHFKLSHSYYGLTAYINFSFQLFDKDGKPWIAELPSASYYNYPVINGLSGSGSWIGTIGQFDYFNESKHDTKLEKAIDMAASKLDEMMTIYPLKEEMGPGLHKYDCQAGGHFVVVFNPDRPDYLIPVTLRELSEAYLNYYKLFQTLEIDRMVYTELKKEIASLSEEELNGPAYAGHPSNIVFRQSSDKRNLPIMRLNPEYWDKSLPPSAIQLMVFWNPEFSEQQMEEHFERFGYPIHSQMLVNQINWQEVSNLLTGKK